MEASLRPSLLLLLRQVNTSRVVMPDVIRHPVFSMDVASQLNRAGFCRNDGNLGVLLPE
jgi:hypothetical protein